MTAYQIGPFTIEKINPTSIVSVPIDNINGTGDVQVRVQFQGATGTTLEWATELVLISKLLFEMVLTAVIHGNSGNGQGLGDDDDPLCSVEVDGQGRAKFIVNRVNGNYQYHALQLLRESFLLADGELQPALAQGGITATLATPIAGLRMGARPFVLMFPETF